MRAARATSRLARTVFSILESLGQVRSLESSTHRNRATILSSVFERLCSIHRIEVDVAGELPAGPCVMVCNHLSYLDPIAVLANLPGVPIAKGEVGSWPLIGAGARALVLLVDRDDVSKSATILRQAIRVLRSGTSVLNFPEGTTTDGSEVLRFKRGIFGAAAIAGVPVVPMAVRFESADMAWTGGQYLVPHYLKMASRPRTRVRLAVGDPIMPVPCWSADDLAGLARYQIVQLLASQEAGRTRGAHHDPAERFGLSPSRPDAVLSAAHGLLRSA